MIQKQGKNKQQKQEQDPNKLILLNGNAVQHPTIRYPTIYLENRIQRQNPYLKLNDQIFITNSAMIDIKYCSLSNIYPDIKTKQIQFEKIQTDIEYCEHLILEIDQQVQHPLLNQYIKQCITGSILNLNQIFYLPINGKQTKITVKQLDNNQFSLITDQTNIIINQNKQIIQEQKDKYFEIRLKSYSQEIQKLVQKILNKQKGKYLLYGLPGQGKTNILYYLQQQNLVKVLFVHQSDEIISQLLQLKEYDVVVADEIDGWKQNQIQQLFTSITDQILIGTTNRPELLENLFEESIEVIASTENKLWQIIVFIKEILNYDKDENQIYQELIDMNIDSVIQSFSPADISFNLQNIKFKDSNFYQQIKDKFISSTPTYNSQYSICSKNILTSYFIDDKTKQLAQKIQEQIQTKQYQNFLLYGLPGTGKGLFIKYFSNISNISIITINSTEISSPYVGQTEINLKRIFQSKSQILFFDECDSLLSGTSNTQRRIIQTFLSQIEKHQQVIICATNRPWLLNDQIINRMQNKIFYTFNSQEQSKQMILDQLKDFIKEKLEDLPQFTQQLFYESLNQLTNAMISEIVTNCKYQMIKNEKLEIEISQIIQIILNIKKEKNIPQDEIQKFENFNQKFQYNKQQNQLLDQEVENSNF